MGGYFKVFQKCDMIDNMSLYSSAPFCISPSTFQNDLLIHAAMIKCHDTEHSNGGSCFADRERQDRSVFWFFSGDS